MRLTFWNVNGYKNFFKFYPQTLPDILGLSETWLLTPISLSVPVSFRDYLNITVEAKKINLSDPGHASGGLALFYHNSLQAEIISSSDYWILARFKRQSPPEALENLIVGLVYLKPSLTSQELDTIIPAFQMVLEEIEDSGIDAPLYIGGDMNARIGPDGPYPEELFEGTVLTSDRALSSVEEDKRGRRLRELMMNNGLLILNGRSPGDKPAHVTYVGARGRSNIDLMFGDLFNLHVIHDFYVEQEVLPSDHFPITLDLLGPRLPVETSHKITAIAPRIVWKRPRIEDYTKQINADRSLVFNPDADVNQLMQTLHKAIWEAANHSGMLVRGALLKLNSDRQPWFDKECQAAKRVTSALLSTCQNEHFQSPTVETFHLARTSYYKLLNNKKEEHFQSIRESLANINSPSDFWKAVRACRARSFSPVLSVEIWQTFYASVYPLRAQGPDIFEGNVDRRLDGPINLLEVESVLLSAKCGKASGSDGIPAEFYKALPPSGTLYLCQLYNKILSEGVMPDSWHEIVMTMVFKKGDKTDPGNYRGIALVNVVVKLFTKIICLRLDKWAEEKHLYPECQAGFRRDRSTLDNIFVALAANPATAEAR